MKQKFTVLLMVLFLGFLTLGCFIFNNTAKADQNTPATTAIASTATPNDPLAAKFGYQTAEIQSIPTVILPNSLLLLLTFVFLSPILMIIFLKLLGFNIPLPYLHSFKIGAID